MFWGLDSDFSDDLVFFCGFFRETIVADLPQQALPCLDYSYLFHSSASPAVHVKIGFDKGASVESIFMKAPFSKEFLVKIDMGAFVDLAKRSTLRRRS